MRKLLDFIGDAHGRAAQLEALLYKLGYRIRNGAWFHPDRIAVFVGDLVDRGPEQFRTVQIVRRMCDAGSAVCIMGNHEHSAIGWVTRDPFSPGEFCRPHTSSNERHHERFLQEAALDPRTYRDHLAWLKTLPPVLEIEGARVAHACWDERYVPTIQKWCKADGSFTEEGLLESLTKGTELYHAFELVAKGPEAKLPAGQSYFDFLGKERREVRIAWWDSQRALRAVALPMPGLSLDALPDVLLEDSEYPQISETHVQFIGHYWMRGKPAPLRRNVASVDYSGDSTLPMTAYRWEGEQELTASHFVQVV